MYRPLQPDRLLCDFIRSRLLRRTLHSKMDINSHIPIVPFRTIHLHPHPPFHSLMPPTPALSSPHHIPVHTQFSSGIRRGSMVAHATSAVSSCRIPHVPRMTTPPTERWRHCLPLPPLPATRLFTAFLAVYLLTSGIPWQLQDTILTFPPKMTITDSITMSYPGPEPFAPIFSLGLSFV